MTFIRRLVWRESCVSIKTINGILYSYMRNGRVELRNTSNSHRDTILEISPYGIILWTMLLKPRTVVVCCNIL